ncbi:MAG: Uma2 family endonuclease [Chloroflexota bacterium]
MREQVKQATTRAAPTAQTIIYPIRDGKPMAETGFHVKLMTYLITMLRAHFRHRRDVYVSGNMFLYYQEGQPRKFVAPDVFVAFGVEGFQIRERHSWFVWKEGKAPDVIFEFTSKATWQEDLVKKKALYEQLGVQEYFLFDPLDEYLAEQLEGYRLEGGLYVPMPSEEGQLESQVLGLVLRAEEGELALYDATTGEPLLPPTAMAEYLDNAEERADREAKRRRALEAEVAALQAELARLRGEESG